MCGIAGAIAFTDEGKKYADRIGNAVAALRHRGPDGEGIFRDGNVTLGHTRLAIIDCSDNAAQPFTSSDGNFTIVFNGEIFNYRELRAELETEGVKFRTESDTEVLLELVARRGLRALDRLQGFFAFALWDKTRKKLLLVRDRLGEKPLYYTWDDDKLLFASEPAALLAFGIPAKTDELGLALYAQLNYIPGTVSAFRQVQKVPAGSYLEYPCEPPEHRSHFYWWAIPFTSRSAPPSWPDAQKKLQQLLEEAVVRRLVSDVPLGAFLSGGVDSSIVAALAGRHKRDLETFSIGFADEPYFDETAYARLVSRHLGTRHHVFSLRNSDLLASLHEFLQHNDEPFADSSALAVNLLARETKKHVTVALSGDGADELFAGYNKHEAELRARRNGLQNLLIRSGGGLWEMLPASRNSRAGNMIRQLRKFSAGLKQESRDRYWSWASIASEAEAGELLVENFRSRTDYISERLLLTGLVKGDDFNEVLRTDMKMVLEGDMLVKVDRMSMLHGLEVRPPFLDHEVVNFVMQLPADYKIRPGNRKRILKDAFRDLLPAEIFNRKKQGFEVPLLSWFRTGLRGMIDELLDEKFLREQNLFHPEAVKTLRKQLHSSNPGDSAARIWGLIVFQSWWRRYMR